MVNRDSSDWTKRAATAEKHFDLQTLHPSWRAFIRYCAELRHGEVELLKIQDGVPVLAEKVKQKVKFG